MNTLNTLLLFDFCASPAPTPDSPPPMDATNPMKAPNTIHVSAPVAPGSASSREAGALVPIDGECLRCLKWYAAQREPATRYELALAVYPPKPPKRLVAGTGPACGRTNTLVHFGYLEEIGRRGRSATLRVTPAGRAWLARRSEAA